MSSDSRRSRSGSTTPSTATTPAESSPSSFRCYSEPDDLPGGPRSRTTQVSVFFCIKHIFKGNAPATTSSTETQNSPRTLRNVGVITNTAQSREMRYFGLSLQHHQLLSQTVRHRQLYTTTFFVQEEVIRQVHVPLRALCVPFELACSSNSVHTSQGVALLLCRLHVRGQFWILLWGVAPFFLEGGGRGGQRVRAQARGVVRRMSRLSLCRCFCVRLAVQDWSARTHTSQVASIASGNLQRFRALVLLC